MEWILYIIGGCLLIAFLSGIGLIPEYFSMIVTAILIGLISGVVAWIFNWEFGTGFKVGMYIGVAIYALYSIMRIINPEIAIEFYSDGSQKVLSDRWNGIIGLVVAVGSVLCTIL